MESGFWTILLFTTPLIGLFIILITGSRFSGRAGVVTSIILFILAILLINSTLTDPLIYRFLWLPNLELGIHISRANAILIVLVAFISLLVQLFSLTYMRDEPAVKRYFALLLFFIFSMLGLLAADHLILLFIFWELVGISSYFLIGFWFHKTANALAARKAFIMNRIADVAFLSGIILLWANDHTLFISEFVSPVSFSPWLILAGFGILIGAMGKSAQFPFFTWLPAAMAGPTPVSALIHAATMVAAGVYLLARTVSIFSPAVMISMIVVGSSTALIGALAAVFQSDIKKVLAYSTVSQLGYMFLAVGVNSADAALFHLWTHAFFKAGLFLAAGSVIHTIHHLSPNTDSQDMSKMGGLKSIIPYTFVTYTICAAALVGIPFFTGFLSKDAILLASWNWSVAQSQSIGNVVYLVPAAGLLVVFLTSFYMFKQISLVFLGRNRNGLEMHPEEESKPIKISLILLALFSMGLWYQINPLAHEIHFTDYFFGAKGSSSTFLVPVFSIGLAALGIGFSFWIFNPTREMYLDDHKPWKIWFKEAFLIEKFYDRIVVSVYNEAARLVRVIDLKVIDRILNFSGVMFVVFAKLMDLTDKLVVDGFVKLITKLTRLMGQLIRSFQSYRVQLHFFWAIAGLLLLVWWLNDWMI